MLHIAALTDRKRAAGLEKRLDLFVADGLMYTVERDKRICCKRSRDKLQINKPLKEVQSGYNKACKHVTR